MSEEETSDTFGRMLLSLAFVVVLCPVLSMRRTEALYRCVIRGLFVRAAWLGIGCLCYRWLWA